MSQIILSLMDKIKELDIEAKEQHKLQDEEFKKDINELYRDNRIINSCASIFKKNIEKHRIKNNLYESYKYENMRKLIKNIKIKIQNFEHQIFRIRNPIQISTQNNNDDDNDKKIRIVCNCPVNKCRGTIISPGHQCSICKVHVCSKCWEVNESKHVCNPEIIEGVSEIKKNCKKCPSCNTMIFRISGCSQMFCTNCKTCFDWNSCKIIDVKHVHNPHLIDYMRTIRSRNHGEHECIDLYDILHFNKNVCNYNLINRIYMDGVRLLGTYDVDELEQKKEEYLEKLRFKYIRSNINQNEFKTKILSYTKRNRRLIDVGMVYQTYVNTIEVILRNKWGNMIIENNENKKKEKKNITVGRAREILFEAHQDIIGLIDILVPSIKNINYLYNSNAKTEITGLLNVKTEIEARIQRGIKKRTLDDGNVQDYVRA